jgi:hypothetical protein
MVKATKIVVYFDDGSTHEVQADKASSVFLKESAAVKCGHNPPYGKPPKSTSTTLSAMSSTETGGDETTVNAQAGTCYMINGVIVCP